MCHAADDKCLHILLRATSWFGRIGLRGSLELSVDRPTRTSQEDTMNTKLKKIAVAVAAAGLAVLGTGVPASAHPAPTHASPSNLWCC